MEKKAKHKLISYITAIAMLIGIFNIPFVGYADTNNAGGYGIFTYNYEIDDGSMKQVLGVYEENIATLPGDPCDYFYVRPVDDERGYIGEDVDVAWTSSDPSVAKCVNSYGGDEIKIEYLSKGTTTISVKLDGVVAASFSLKLSNIGIGYDMADQLEYEPYYSPLYNMDSLQIEMDQPVVVQAHSGSPIFDEDKAVDAEWSVADKSIAEISADQDGNMIVSGVKQGHTTITAVEKGDASNRVTYDLYVLAPVSAKNAKWIIDNEKAALYAVDEGWNGVIPEEITYDGKSYPVTSIYGIIDIYEESAQVAEITIPKTVASIPEEGFTRFEKLERINVADDNPAFYDKDGVLFTAADNTLYAYPAGKSDTSYTIPKGTKHINLYAFDNYNDYLPITKITVHEELELKMGYNYFGVLGDYDYNTKKTTWQFEFCIMGENESVVWFAQSMEIPYTHYADILKAPTSVSVGLYGYDDIKFSWNKVSGASGYYVYYKKASATEWSGPYDVGTKLVFNKADLDDGVSYQFRVYPYMIADGAKCRSSNYKASPEIYTLKKLSAPKVTKKTKKYVKVSWNNIPGETGYQIARSTKKNKGFKVVKTVKSTKAKNTTIKTAQKKTYYYKIRAYKTVNGKKIYGPWSSAKKYKLK